MRQGRGQCSAYAVWSARISLSTTGELQLPDECHGGPASIQSHLLMLHTCLRCKAGSMATSVHSLHSHFAIKRLYYQPIQARSKAELTAAALAA